MSERQWLRITACENIPPREGRTAMAGDREIALFNLGDRFLAVGSRCPHQGGPLADGIVTGASVVCPLHAWKVNLQTGEVERPAHGKDHCVATYPTRVEEGVVLIGLPAANAGTPEGAPYEPGTPEGAPYVGHPFKGANRGAAA